MDTKGTEGTLGVSKYRIVEKEYSDGGIAYGLEQETNKGMWRSVYSHKDLDVIRKAKAEREAHVVSTKVIE